MVGAKCTRDVVYTMTNLIIMMQNRAIELDRLSCRFDLNPGTRTGDNKWTFSTRPKELLNRGSSWEANSENHTDEQEMLVAGSIESSEAATDQMYLVLIYRK